MNTYENAPATKLLATACACCGRALVDAVSVETGIGPDCRAKHGVVFEADNAAHDEANRLVHAVARKGIAREEARAIWTRIAELGFVALAERIAKRFRTTITPVVEVVEAPAAVATPSIEAMRAEYAKVRDAMTYELMTAAAFANACRGELGPDHAEAAPSAWVRAAHAVAEGGCSCPACNGTGDYDRGDMGFAGPCFRCDGKGFQTIADAFRNRAYDAHRRNRRAA